MGFAEKSLLTALKTHLRSAQDSRDLAPDDESRAAIDAGIASLTQQIAVLEGGGSLTDLAKVTGSSAGEEDAVTAALGESDHTDAVAAAWSEPDSAEVDTEGLAAVGEPSESSSFGGVFSGTSTRKALVIGAVIVIAAGGLFLAIRLFGGDFWNGGCSTWSPNTGWQSYDADDPFCDGD